MPLWRRSAPYGCHLILLLTCAAASSFSDKCWPSVHLLNATDKPSGSSLEAEAGSPGALWIRGLPCRHNGPCCSAKVLVGQGATLSMMLLSEFYREQITEEYEL